MKTLTSPILSITLAALLLSTTACNQSGGDSPAATPKADLKTEQIENDFKISSRRSVELNAESTNFDRYAKALNTFIIEILIPKTKEITSAEAIPYDNASEKRKLTGKETAGGILFSDQVHIRDNFPNVAYKIQYNLKLSNGEQITKEISLYKDILVVDSRSLDEVGLQAGKNRIGRLHLVEGATLQNGKSELTIEADELVANNSTIETYSELNSRRTSEQSRGKNGGNITILAKNATGVLAVNMRGVDGAPGVNTPNDSLPGDNGAAGEPGEVFCNWKSRVVNRFQQEEWNPDSCSCVKQAKNGEAGKPGKDGKPGGDGFNGGDSGAFNLTVLNKLTDLSVRITSQPGYGGRPGTGALGGPGGPGGARGLHLVRDNRGGWRPPPNPNPVDISTDPETQYFYAWAVTGCPVASAGLKGPDGHLSAVPAVKGVDGAKAPSCYRFGLESTHQCFQ